MDFHTFCFKYSLLELNTAVKPFMFLKLFGEFSYDWVLYFDPDIELYNPLKPVVEALHAGATFVLTPHLLEPAENDAPRDDLDIMRAGTYNLGFLACSRQPETEPNLRWWGRRLLSHCVREPKRGLFVDQKFMDLLPGFADHVRVLRDPTLNVAYWNLKQRPLSRNGKTWMIGGAPLTFFHFSGVDPYDTSILSKHTHHFRGEALTPPLRDLIDEYCAKICAHAPHTETSGNYSYGRFASGTEIHSLVRQMFREVHVPWVGNPFENYEAFLHEPAFGCNHDLPVFVTNLMHYCWQRTPSLKYKFNLQKAPGVEAYTRWYVENAQSKWGLDPRLVEPVATRMASRTRPRWSIRH